MNCSPSMARMRFSQQRDARPLRRRMIHFPPLLLASSYGTGHRPCMGVPVQSNATLHKSLCITVHHHTITCYTNCNVDAFREEVLKSFPHNRVFSQPHTSNFNINLHRKDTNLLETIYMKHFIICVLYRVMI